MKQIAKMLSATALLAMCAVYAGPANAALQAVGPVNAVTTLPEFYQDLSGLALTLCLDQNNFCVLPPNFDPLITAPPLPITTIGPIDDTNFPDESFYFLADSQVAVANGGIARLRLALEAAFLNPTPPIVVPGQGVTFLRVNLAQLSGLTPLSTYTVTHPYGTFTFTTDGLGNTAGRAFRTEDPLNPVQGIFDALLPATTTNIGPFLVAAGGPVTDPGTGNKYIGNPNAPTAVTGSPNGNNLFRIDGPNIAGPGVNTVQTTQFTLSGKLVGLQVDPPVDGNDFGVWNLTTPVPAKTYTVTNLSSSTFAPTLASSNPAFAITPGTCGVAVAPNGTCTFTVTFTPAAPDGAKTSTISLSNAAVPTVNIAVTGTADGTAPTLTLDPVVTFTNLVTQRISGSVSDNTAVASVQISVNGVSQGTATITPGNPASTWIKDIALSNTTPGGTANSISVTATDTAQTVGNLSAAQTATITTDTVQPVVVITSPAAGLTNNNNPTLTFTPTDTNLAFSNVIVDNSPVNTTPATLGPLADGQHTATINSGDSAGNLGTASVTFTVDTIAPAITVTSPKILNARLGQTTPALTVTVNDANLPVNTVVTLDGVNVTAQATLGPFTAGSAHTLVVNSTDGAGNLATTNLPFTIVLSDGRIVSLGVDPPGIADALAALRHAVGLTTLIGDAFAHGNVAPLDANGIPNPDSVIDISDALTILRRAVGLITTF